MAPKKKRVVEKEMESLENEDSEEDDEEDMEELGDESDDDAIGQVNMSADVNFSTCVQTSRSIGTSSTFFPYFYRPQTKFANVIRVPTRPGKP